MKYREARIELSRSLYRVLFAHQSEIAIENNERGEPRTPGDHAIMHQAYLEFMEKLRVRGEEK